jgi:flagellar protein FlaJ
MALLKRVHWIGIIAGSAALLADLLFLLLGSINRNLFFFIAGLAAAVIALPFVLGVAAEGRREEEINSMFLEFSRNLAESVSTGTPISKSIINVSKKNYGVLSPYVLKASNQISIGIPVGTALQTFAKDVNNNVIARAVALISEAERAGGEIDFILESVAKSIAEVEKLKKERKAAISNLVVQGYLIFIIFIGIMLVMEFKILPLTAGLSSFTGTSGTPLSGVGLGGGTSATLLSPENLARPFLYLLLAQGIFAGLTIGKISEGSVKAGIKHSFILTILAFLISTGARVLLG